MLKGLFLDDLRAPIESDVKYPQDVEWTVVRDAKSWHEAVTTQDFDVYSFDFDLGRMKPNGLGLLHEFSDLCIEKKRFPEHVYMHSGDSRMRRIMEELYQENKTAFDKGWYE